MPPSPLLYFAYGSNMLLARIRQRDRAPAAQPVGVAALPAHELRFHKRGRDGSGKCDAAVGREASAGPLWGVLYRVTPAEKAALDRVEGTGYRERTVAVRLGRELVTAYTYQARPGAIDPALRPFAWYKDIVLAGAREHGLPAAYVGAVEAVEGVCDPETAREQAVRCLLDQPAGRER